MRAGKCLREIALYKSYYHLLKTCSLHRSRVTSTCGRGRPGEGLGLSGQAERGPPDCAGRAGRQLPLLRRHEVQGPQEQVVQSLPLVSRLYSASRCTVHCRVSGSIRAAGESLRGAVPSALL